MVMLQNNNYDEHYKVPLKMKQNLQNMFLIQEASVNIAHFHKKIYKIKVIMKLPKKWSY